MTPINTMNPSQTMPDNLRRELEAAIPSELAQDAEQAFRDMDRQGSVEASATFEAAAPRVSSETAEGAPIVPRDLFSSDEAYEMAVAAAREQLEQSRIDQEQKERSDALRNIGERLKTMRGSYSA